MIQFDEHIFSNGLKPPTRKGLFEESFAEKCLHMENTKQIEKKLSRVKKYVSQNDLKKIKKDEQGRGGRSLR